MSINKRQQLIKQLMRELANYEGADPFVWLQAKAFDHKLNEREQFRIALNAYKYKVK